VTLVSPPLCHSRPCLSRFRLVSLSSPSPPALSLALRPLLQLPLTRLTGGKGESALGGGKTTALCPTGRPFLLFPPRPALPSTLCSTEWRAFAARRKRKEAPNECTRRQGALVESRRAKRPAFPHSSHPHHPRSASTTSSRDRRLSAAAGRPTAATAATTTTPTLQRCRRSGHSRRAATTTRCTISHRPGSARAGRAAAPSCCPTPARKALTPSNSPYPPTQLAVCKAQKGAEAAAG